METTDQYSSSYNTNGLFGVKKFANKHAITKDWYFVSIIFYSSSTGNSKWHVIYVDGDTRLYKVGCFRMKCVKHGVSSHKCLEKDLCWKTQYIKSHSFCFTNDCIQQCVSRKKPHTKPSLWKQMLSVTPEKNAHLKPGGAYKFILHTNVWRSVIKPEIQRPVMINSNVFLPTLRWGKHTIIRYCMFSQGEDMYESSQEQTTNSNQARQS